MTIAITAANGQLGRLVIQHLTKRVAANNILALVRSPEKASDLGVAVKAADYSSDAATLQLALTGVDTLLLISGNELGQRVAQHRNMIEAAKLAGVRHLVYTSLLHADRSSLNLAPEHFETEQLIKASGLSYTILRNGWYAENYTGNLAPAIAHGALVGSAADGKMSLATRSDYAEAAAIVLANPATHAGLSYELAGDSAPTMSDLAQEISAQTGKTIPYHSLPEHEFAAILLQAGLPEVWANGIAGWDVEAAKGVLFDDSKQLSALLGRPTTPISDYVRAALAAV